MKAKRRDWPGQVSPSPNELAEYAERIARLVACVRAINKSDSDVTLKRRTAEAFASQLVDLADRLADAGSVQFELAAMHERPARFVLGHNGLPRPDKESESRQGSYFETVWRMRVLADSASRLAESMPDPRQKPALPFAIMGFLHLRHRHGFPRPTLYADGPDVAALAALVEAAGIHLSAGRLRNALSAGLKDFDPFLTPPGLDDCL